MSDAAILGPVILIVLMGIWGFGRVSYMRLQYGISVLSFLGQKKSNTEKMLAGIAVVLNIYLCMRAFYPALDAVTYALPAIAVWPSLAVMAAGVLLMMICQAQMGLAWRVGVPTEKENGQQLICSGLYRYSRNPIYVGVVMFLAGAALLVPGLITFLSLFFSLPLITQVILREEAFMRQTFGAEYTSYCTRVRRWV